MGFPIALVLAWAFDITPAGVKRTEPLGTPEGPGRRHPGAIAIFGAGLVMALVVGVVLLFPRGGPALDRDRVVVAVFENQTGDAAFDPLGRMAQDWITQGLARTGFVDVVPTTAALQSYRCIMPSSRT